MNQDNFLCYLSSLSLTILLGLFCLNSKKIFSEKTNTIHPAFLFVTFMQYGYKVINPIIFHTPSCNMEHIVIKAGTYSLTGN